MAAFFASSLLILLLAASVFHLVASTTHTNTEFIRSSCASTQYPDRCFKSLYRFADKINQNPALLTRVAITVSLSWVNHFVVHLNKIPAPDSSINPTNISQALEDCVNEFNDVLDQINGSLQQMEQLSSHGERLRFDLSNVQTWMSSALTDEDTCMVGFNGVPDGYVKTDVIGRVAELKEVTSNALSLVNGYVSMVL